MSMDVKKNDAGTESGESEYSDEKPPEYSDDKPPEYSDEEPPEYSEPELGNESKSDSGPSIAYGHFANILSRDDGRYMEFEVSGVDLAIINSLKRIVTTGIETACLGGSDSSSSRGGGGPSDADTTGIAFKANVSPLHNEQLADRLSLLPVHLTENELAELTRGEVEYTFTLRVSNAGPTRLDVTSGDITGARNGIELDASTLARIFPADPLTKDHVLITVLRPAPQSGVAADTAETDSTLAAAPVDQRTIERIDMTCKLVLGTGKRHARWIPTSVCAFGNVVDEQKSVAALDGELAQARALNATDEELAVLRHNFSVTGRLRHFVVNAHNEASRFVFRLRSECGLRPAYLIFKGLRILAERLTRLAAAVRELADDKITPLGSVPGMYDFRIDNEDHTIGNLVQSLIYNEHIRDGQESGSRRRLVYVGYNQPHPNEPQIVFRIKIASEDDDGVLLVGDARDFFANCVDRVRPRVESLLPEWTGVSGLQLLAIREVSEYLERL